MALEFGYTPNEQATEAYVSALPQPYFYSAVPIAETDTKDTNAFLWRALSKALGKKILSARNQLNVGSCVGNATATSGETVSAVEIFESKQPEEFHGRFAADGLYALSRDVSGNLGRGDGSYGSAAAKALTEVGAIYMQAYAGGKYDLSTYSADRCRMWAAKGVPSEVKEEAKKNPFRQAAMVRTCEEARSALQNGFAINVCSGQGFDDVRDADGFCRAQGSWPHSMSVVAYRGGSRRGFGIWNSWGDNWVKGPVWPEDMPLGFFWCDWDVFERMLRGRDTFAYSDFQGFRIRNIDWELAASHWE